MAKRALVIFPGALGDLICLLPALRVLARRYRDCDLELMARAELADLAVGRMRIARGHSIDRREVSLLFSRGDDAVAGAREFFRAFSSIHSFFGSDDPPFRAVLTLAGGGEVFFHPFRPEANSHISAAYVDALGEPRDETGIQPVTGGQDRPQSCPAEPGSMKSPAGIDLRAEDLREAERLLAACGAQQDRFILVMPGSGSRTKNWPAENYVRLAQKLSESSAVVVVLGPAEAGLEKAFSQFRTIRNPSLGALAALARLSHAFVGNDSGVSHLAAAAGGSGVVIFGPTDPARWRPLGRVVVLSRTALETLQWPEVAAAIDGLTGNAESTR